MLLGILGFVIEPFPLLEHLVEHGLLVVLLVHAFNPVNRYIQPSQNVQGILLMGMSIIKYCCSTFPHVLHLYSTFIMVPNL